MNIGLQTAIERVMQQGMDFHECYAWRVARIDSMLYLYHYDTEMLVIHIPTSKIVRVSPGRGSKTDQDGMNTAFFYFSIPYYYSRRKAPHLEFIQKNGRVESEIWYDPDRDDIRSTPRQIVDNRLPWDQ